MKRTGHRDGDGYGCPGAGRLHAATRRKPPSPRRASTAPRSRCTSSSTACTRERTCAPSRKEEASHKVLEQLIGRTADHREGREGQDGRPAGRRTGHRPWRAAKCWRAPMWSRRPRASRPRPKRRCTRISTPTMRCSRTGASTRCRNTSPRCRKTSSPSCVRSPGRGQQADGRDRSVVQGAGRAFRVVRKSTHPAEQIPAEFAEGPGRRARRHGLVARGVGNQVPT